MALVRASRSASAVALRVLRYLARAAAVVGLGMHGRRLPRDEPAPVPPAVARTAMPEAAAGRLTPDELLWRAELGGIDQ